MNIHIDLAQLEQIGEIIGSVIAIDGIIKQVALKQGNTKLVSICDVIANDLNEIITVLQAIPSLFAKPSTSVTAQKVD
jgi:hypothetical protein